MPCDTRIPVGLTAAQRNAQITAALRRLEAGLSGGRVRVTIGANGAVAFTGWAERAADGTTDRDGVSDVCAYRLLSVQNSFALRQAVQRAELVAGRKLNPQAVSAGVHSHDGGNTWHPGHK